MKSRYIIIVTEILLTQSAFATSSSSPQIQVNPLEVVFQDQKDLTTVAALSDTAAVPETELSQLQGEPITSDQQIFGYQGGYIHAALALNEEYTDNLYNVQSYKQSNLHTTVTPAAWIAFPRRDRAPIQIAPHNTSTGGLQLSQPYIKFANKYQIYFKGGLEYNNYSENADLNRINTDLEGMAQYNPSTDLTLQLVDKFTNNQDQFDLTNATEDNQRVFNSNLLRAGAGWDFSEKFTLKFNYNNFILSYDDAVNAFLNRSDNGFDLYAYYDYSPKTNLFLQYKYLVASYDETDESDNSNNFLYGGINWQYSVKTWLMAKLGYQQIDYDNEDTVDSPGTFSFEAQMFWRATVKTSVIIDTAYSIEQSDSYQALNKKVFFTRVGYEQRLTDRLSGSINFIYQNSDYNQIDDSSRVDNRYSLKPQLNYLFREWLKVEISYSYDSRDSSDDSLNYDTNTFYLGISTVF